MIFKFYSVQTDFNHWHTKRYEVVGAKWGGKELLILVGETVYLKERSTQTPTARQQYLQYCMLYTQHSGKN
jgi:hypothetical protein